MKTWHVEFNLEVDDTCGPADIFDALQFLLTEHRGWKVVPDWRATPQAEHAAVARIREALLNPQTTENDLVEIIKTAVQLEGDLYAKRDTIKSLFALRKSLEGLFGCDLPYVDDPFADEKE